MRQIFLDTETTGLEPESGDRIVEVGCIEMIDRRLTGNDKHFYVNPGRANAARAVEIHGLSDDFLADKPPFAAIADELFAYLEDAEVLIHNADFDVRFLNVELAALGRPLFHEIASNVIDTWAMAREMYPGKSNSLDALCRRLEVDSSSRTHHGALIDAGLLAEVYIRMTRGQDSLVIDHHDATPLAQQAARLDLSTLDLPVIDPDADELAAHEAWLVALDKSSGGKTVWRTWEAPTP